MAVNIQFTEVLYALTRAIGFIIINYFKNIFNNIKCVHKDQ